VSAEDGFLRALREQPADEAARGAYADWLEERGDPRGEFLRLSGRVLADLRRLGELRPGLAAEWLRQVDRAAAVRAALRGFLGHPAGADRWYRTAAGREVYLDQLHVQRFGLGWMEGRAELIRARVLETLPQRARQIYPGNNGLLITEVPRETEGPYPRWIFLAELLSFEPVHPPAHCSGLIVVWFGDEVAVDLDDLVAENLRDVVWEDHAADGYW
jgi:uncharacterized protein (TIGR02996 family)